MTWRTGTDSRYNSETYLSASPPELFLKEQVDVLGEKKTPFSLFYTDLEELLCGLN